MQNRSIKWNNTSNLAGVLFFAKYSTLPYFFVKKNFFFECLYFREYDIRISLYVFWLRKGPSVKCVLNWWGRCHPNYVQLCNGEGGVMTHVYVRTYTISFHGVSALISSIIWARKNDISFKFNYTQAWKWGKNTSDSLIEYFNSYCKKRKLTCIFNQRNLFNSLIHSPLSSIIECS